MSKGKINIYECPKGHLTTTVDTDEGVTPMFLGCKRDGCAERSTSMGYNVPQHLTAEYEWYKPTDLKGLSSAEKDHVKKGGLLIRQIPEGHRKATTIQERLAMLRPSTP